MQKTIDVQVKQFFDSVYAYVNKMSMTYSEKQDKESFARGIKMIQHIERQLKDLYATKNKAQKCDLVVSIMSTGINPYLFMQAGSNDNRMYWAFMAVLRGIAEHYRDDYFEMTFDLKNSLYKWYYLSSTNVVGKLYWRFKARVKE